MNILIDSSQNIDVTVYLKSNKILAKGDKVMPSAVRPGIVEPFLRKFYETDEKFEKRAKLDPRVLGECVSFDIETMLAGIKLWK